MNIEPELKKTLSKWKSFLFHQKYRFDLGQQFFVFLNLTLLIIATSDKLRIYTQIHRTWVMVSILVPLGFLGVWLLGYFLDKVVRYGQAANLEAAKRNPLWEQQVGYFERIERDLGKIKNKLGAS